MTPSIPAPTPPDRGRGSAPIKKVLLVDDDDSLRQTLAEQLRLFEEFTVVEAATGSKALEIAKLDHFDAMLLDVGLPDIDGREVCRLLRRAGALPPPAADGTMPAANSRPASPPPSTTPRPSGE